MLDHPWRVLKPATTLAVALVLVVCAASWHPTSAAAADIKAVRVSSGNVILDPTTHQPKVVLSVYEDFLCPACATFDKTFGPTIDNLIDTGKVAADYYLIAILDNSQRDYSSRAGAAAYCVADQSITAFRAFRKSLLIAQPGENGATFPDDRQLISDAQEAGAPNAASCINKGTYLPLVRGLADATHVNGAPNISINGMGFDVTNTPDDLVARVNQIIGNAAA